MELSHDALDQGDSNAVVLQDAIPVFGVACVERLPPRLPAVHEMIGCQHVAE